MPLSPSIGFDNSFNLMVDIAPTTDGSFPTPVNNGLAKVTLEVALTVVLVFFAISSKVAPFIFSLIHAAFFLVMS